MLVAHETITLLSQLTTCNVTSLKHLVLGCRMNSSQDTITLISSVMYVKFHLCCLEQAWHNQGFLYIKQYTLTGITLTFEQESVVVLRNLVLLLWGFNLYSIFVTRCCVACILVSGCVDLICICKQNELSLELKLASDLLHTKSCAEALPTIN